MSPSLSAASPSSERVTVRHPAGGSPFGPGYEKPRTLSDASGGTLARSTTISGTKKVPPRSISQKGASSLSVGAAHRIPSSTASGCALDCRV